MTPPVPDAAGEPTERFQVRADAPEIDGYRWLTSLVVPRPIAWVSTVSADGVSNLAPHSFFTVVSARPPMVQFTSVGEKDTLRNVRATGEFVVNLAPEELIDEVNATSARLAPEIDEAQQVGLVTEASYVVTPARVAAAPASIECRLHRTLPVGDSTLVIGEVVAFSVRREALRDGLPAIDALRPLSRLDGDQWGLPPAVVRRTRPT